MWWYANLYQISLTHIRSDLWLISAVLEFSWWLLKVSSNRCLKICMIPFVGTLNASCSKAPAPAQQSTRKANESIIDGNLQRWLVPSHISVFIPWYVMAFWSYVHVACYWVDCGGGSCINSTSLFSYNCKCDAGYYNLLNATALPCFRECESITRGYSWIHLFGRVIYFITGFEGGKNYLLCSHFSQCPN